MKAMARPRTKAELLDAASAQYRKLEQLVASMGAPMQEATFTFTGDRKHMEPHWRRDRDLRDVLAHLHSWQRMLVDWVSANRAGSPRPFLPDGYHWRTPPALNQRIWAEYQDMSLERVSAMLADSHADVLALIEGVSDEELFTKAYFSWTGTTSLGSYCVSATSSHYDWALKKLRVHMAMAKQR